MVYLQVNDEKVTVEQSLALSVQGLEKGEDQSIMEEGPGDFTCAICLNEIDLPELAMVKGCEHVYCGKATLNGVVIIGQRLVHLCKRLLFSNILCLIACLRQT